MGFWTVHLLKFDNIKSVQEMEPPMRFGAWNASNFKSRFFARTFLIETHTGWFTRKVLITPDKPDTFLTLLHGRGVSLL
jgi:hypothetical protein